MSTTTRTTTTPIAAARLADGRWRLDPARSSVTFHVRHFYGLMTVKGEFADYDGTLDLDATPAVALTIQATSLDTKLAKRDEHLRSEDFFDVERHPHVRFISEHAAFDGDLLRVRGQLHAAGRQIALELDATVREIDGELEIEAVTQTDHRELGMTWSPLGILRPPANSSSAAASCVAKGEPTHESHIPRLRRHLARPARGPARPDSGRGPGARARARLLDQPGRQLDRRRDARPDGREVRVPGHPRPRLRRRGRADRRRRQRLQARRPGLRVPAARNPTAHAGAWAELITVTEELSIAHAPDGVDLATAGAAPLAGITALMSFDALDLSEGDIVLVVGATGDVGSLAVQLAARAGARVLTPALPEDESFLRELGVSEVLPRDGDIAQLVRERYPDGVDALLDLVNYTAGTYDPALKPGARVASPTGAAGEGPGRTNVMASPTGENLKRLGELLANGTLRIPVQATYPLAQAPQALAALAGEHTQGKLAIQVH